MNWFYQHLLVVCSICTVFEIRICESFRSLMCIKPSCKVVLYEMGGGGENCSISNVPLIGLC